MDEPKFKVGELVWYPTNFKEYIYDGMSTPHTIGTIKAISTLHDSYRYECQRLKSNKDYPHIAIRSEDEIRKVTELERLIYG